MESWISIFDGRRRSWSFGDAGLSCQLLYTEQASAQTQCVPVTVRPRVRLQKRASFLSCRGLYLVFLTRFGGALLVRIYLRPNVESPRRGISVSQRHSKPPSSLNEDIKYRKNQYMLSFRGASILLKLPREGFSDYYVKR